MNAKERVRAAFNHQEPDRVPIFELTVTNPILSRILGRKIVGTVSGEQKAAAIRVNMKGRDARRELIKENIAGMLEAYVKIGFDMIWIRPTEYLAPVFMALNDYIAPNYLFDTVTEEIEPNVFRILSPEWGFWSIEKYSPFSNSCLNIQDSIKTNGIKELERYVEYLEKAPMTVEGNEPIQDGLDGLRLAIEREASLLGGLFICGNADVAFPTFQPFLEMFLLVMMDRPALAHRYMEATTRGTLELLKAQLGMGVDGVIGGTDICYNVGPLISPNAFRKFVAPYLKMLVDECHKYNIPYIKHLDGNVKPLLKILVEEIGIDGLHSIEPPAGMNIAEIKAQYGDRLTLLGNIDCAETLTGDSRDKVVAEVYEIIQKASPGGGHIFASSNCIHSGVNYDSFITMIEIVKKFGVYPIGS